MGRQSLLPQWILDSNKEKNNQQGIPASETTRIVGPNFAINSSVSVERDMQLAKEAMWALPAEAVDDYDIWITIGQSLHQLDESMLDEWDNWSKQSEKYREGECHKRWRSFSDKGGRTLGSLIHIAQEHGWKPSQDYKAMGVDDNTIDLLAAQLAEIEAQESKNPTNTMAPGFLYPYPKPKLRLLQRSGRKRRRRKTYICEPMKLF